MGLPGRILGMEAVGRSEGTGNQNISRGRSRTSLVVNGNRLAELTLSGGLKITMCNMDNIWYSMKERKQRKVAVGRHFVHYAYSVQGK